MNILELVRDRHSTRGPFDPERPIPEEHMQQILEGARWAPTAHNMQNFEIVVVDDRDTLGALSRIPTETSQVFVEENAALLSSTEDELRKKKVGLLAAMFPPSWRTPGGKPHLDEEHSHSVLGAPIRMSSALIVALYDPRKRAPASEGDVLGIMSLGCVLENIWLVARSLEIDLQVQSVLGSGGVERKVRELLAIPDRLTIGFAARLGYSVAYPTYLRVRRDVKEFTHRNLYGKRERVTSSVGTGKGEALAPADADLRARVLEELTWDPRVAETGIAVQVHSGVVTLTGIVNSWVARAVAQDAAHEVHGVLDVVNDINVHPSGISQKSDTDLARAVRNVLEWDALVPDADIQTTITDGVVTLEGTVDSYRQHEDAERCVRNLVGVAQVRNLITVKPPVNEASSATLRTAIERALERRRPGTAKHVHLRTSGGTVMLSGAVPSWRDWKAVESAVRGTTGVQRVDNQLRIQPAVNG